MTPDKAFLLLVLGSFSLSLFMFLFEYRRHTVLSWFQEYDFSVCYTVLTGAATVCYRAMLVQYRLLDSLCCAFYSCDLLIP